MIMGYAWNKIAAKSGQPNTLRNNNSKFVNYNCIGRGGGEERDQLFFNSKKNAFDRSYHYLTSPI